MWIPVIPFNLFKVYIQRPLTQHLTHNQPGITCSKSTREKLEQGVKYVRS